MNALLDLQKDFTRFVWHGQYASAAKIVANGIDPERRLAIYRNNTVLSLTETLRGIYPGLERLVGDAFFRYLCRSFITDRPPRNASLIGYGRELADFLTTWPAVRELQYLCDIVRLEWLEHEIYHEAPDAMVRPADLRSVPEDCYGNLCFRLNPTVRLFRSSYPLDIIRSLCRDNSVSGEWIDLNEGGCRLLLCRPEWEVEVLSLDEAGYRFFEGLQAGSTLCEAAATAMASNSEFDLLAALQLAFAKALLAFFTLD